MEKKIEPETLKLRKRVYSFYFQHRSRGKNFTFLHFKDEGVARSTIYSIIQRAESRKSAERVPGSGRKAKIMTKKNIKALKSLFDHNHRQAAKKFGCSQPLVCQTLKKHTEIKKRKKVKIPKRTDEQKQKIRTLCGRLYLKYQNTLWIIDDESYFTLTHSTINGNNNYYTSNNALTPPEVNYYTKTKFEKKLLVWICLSAKGISSVYYVPSGQAINQEVYLKNCIKKRLIPFINAHHSDGNYVFWPDLASSH